MMIKHYIKSTLRYMRRNTVVTTINVLGLSVGLACAALIALWVQDEMSYDRFHERKDELYLLTIKHPNDVFDPNVPYALAPLLASEFPEIVEYTRIYRLGNLMTCSFKYQPNDGRQTTYYEGNVNLVDPAFFNMFTFPFIRGKQENVFTNPNSVVITEEIAGKYFGSEDPVGKILTFNNREDLEVTGVVRVPSHSHLQFDFLLPLTDPLTNDWNWRDPSYVLLDQNGSVLDLKAKIAGALAEYSPYPMANDLTVDIKPIDEIYLGFGRKTYVYIFSVIAVLILVIACINYVNLSTACSSKRAKEIGLCKVVGAKKGQLVSRFLSESFIMSTTAFVPSILITWISLPIVNHLTSKEVTLFTGNSIYVFFSLFGIALVLGIVSGIYPALYLTSMKPVNTFKAIPGFGKNRSFFRLVSVVGQFTISTLLIAGTIIVYQQLNFVQNRPLGINTHSVLSIRMNETLSSRYGDFKSELLRNPNVVTVTAGQAVPYDEDYKTGGINWATRDPQMAPMVRYSVADFDYMETFEMTLVEGRTFSEAHLGDRNNYVINEEAARYMNMEAPVGQTLEFWGQTGTIIGVVKDFHHVSLHREILPQIFTVNPAFQGSLQHIFVRINAADVPNTIVYLADASNRFAPDYPFEYTFLDEGLGNLYLAEQKMGKLFGYFAGIAILISCLGIFGLSVYAAEQRFKEIGIRKAFGASIERILVLLFKDFAKLVLMAIVIAVPIAFFVMNRWLQDFAYRIDISVVTLVLVGGLVLAVAALTVGYQSLKAALTNPVDALRYE